MHQLIQEEDWMPLIFQYGNLYAVRMQGRTFNGF